MLTRLGSDLFITVVDPRGNTLFAKNYGGKNVETIAVGLLVDADGAITLSGSFAGGDMLVPSIQIGGRRDGFVLKQTTGISLGPTPPIAPDSPTIERVISGDQQITVTFNPPTQNGGSAIIDYTVRCGENRAVGASSPIVVKGLTNGRAVTCDVTARKRSWLK